MLFLRYCIYVLLLLLFTLGRYIPEGYEKFIILLLLLLVYCLFTILLLPYVMVNNDYQNDTRVFRFYSQPITIARAAVSAHQSVSVSCGSSLLDLHTERHSAEDFNSGGPSRRRIAAYHTPVKCWRGAFLPRACPGFFVGQDRRAEGVGFVGRGSNQLPPNS